MSRFTIQMTIRDELTGESYHYAMPCDDALRVSIRDVEAVKAGLYFGAPNVSPLEATASVMKVREFRRAALKSAAINLAGCLADTLQDAEGWHDASRIEPARKLLGGRWDY